MIFVILLWCARLARADTGDSFRVKFDVSKLDGVNGKAGSFFLEIHPKWAPLGAQRFKELLDDDFFKDIRFFRVIGGFVAQFGIHGIPDQAAKWRARKIKDDPVLKRNTRGRISFATSGPNSRTTQMFINLGDNSVNLDGMGFSPFGEVVFGMDVVDRIFKIGEQPQQFEIQRNGNKYLDNFPQITYIERAELVDANFMLPASLSPCIVVGTLSFQVIFLLVFI